MICSLDWAIWLWTSHRHPSSVVFIVVTGLSTLIAFDHCRIITLVAHGKIEVHTCLFVHHRLQLTLRVEWRSFYTWIQVTDASVTSVTAWCRATRRLVDLTEEYRNVRSLFEYFTLPPGGDPRFFHSWIRAHHNLHEMCSGRMNHAFMLSVNSHVLVESFFPVSPVFSLFALFAVGSIVDDSTILVCFRLFDFRSNP